MKLFKSTFNRLSCLVYSSLPVVSGRLSGSEPCLKLEMDDERKYTGRPGWWGVGGRPKFQILFTENHTGNCNLHCGTARGVKAYCLAGQCFTMWDRGSQIKLTEIICWVYSLFGVCGFLDFGIIWHVVLLPSLNLILLLPIYVKGVDLIPCSEFPGRYGGIFVFLLYFIFSLY